MIAYIRGLLREQRTSSVLLDVQGLSYEVFVPAAILRALEGQVTLGEELSLVTFHYHQLEPSRGVPVLIGFQNEIEREFFERFITVSGVGPKAALKALSQPIPVIAQAIDAGDLSTLKSLPGIGEQRAKEIVAKLQGKVGKFGLMQEREAGVPSPAAPPTDQALEDEVLAVLLQLQYTRSEAKQMIRQAMAQQPGVKSAEELLNVVYRQRRQADAGVAA